ncbi:MAG: Lrp/AsnC ligand binding domain-containing protein [candidate division NC10 bacterium]|nr:Lrp/AsnC ligand binding domain-containing protein [candidate division NC10 bacterium]
MAISAYIFIECSLGKARDVAREIGKIPGVKQAHAVTGAYDVIAFVEASDINVLGDFIISRVHALSGVFRTTTNVVVD